MPSNSLPSGSPSKKNEWIHTSLGSNTKVFSVSVASLSLSLSFCGLPIGDSKGVTLTDLCLYDDLTFVGSFVFLP